MCVCVCVACWANIRTDTKTNLVGVVVCRRYQGGGEDQSGVLDQSAGRGQYWFVDEHGNHVTRKSGQNGTVTGHALQLGLHPVLDCADM